MMRILIADDHAIVRRGLKEMLLDEYPSATIGEAQDSEQLIAKIFREKWDVVICDLNMPGRSGLDALRQIKQSNPQLPVLIMSVYPEDQYAVRALRAGASGYFSKDSIHDQLIRAIETVRMGRRFITPAVADKLVEAVNTRAGEHPHHLLSNRELDVLKLLAIGKTVSEIAVLLLLSPNTVSTYRARILHKMDMRSNADLIRYALENHLLR